MPIHRKITSILQRKMMKDLFCKNDGNPVMVGHYAR